MSCRYRFIDRPPSKVAETKSTRIKEKKGEFTTCSVSEVNMVVPDYFACTACMCVVCKSIFGTQMGFVLTKRIDIFIHDFRATKRERGGLSNYIYMYQVGQTSKQHLELKQKLSVMS